MKTNRIIAILILAAAVLFPVKEIAFVLGPAASLVVVAGLVTTLVFSVMNNTKAEVAMANGETLEVEGYGLRARANGKDIFLLILFMALVGLGYLHHVQEETAMTKLFEAIAENTYVLSLPQADRERLQIQMPESLRRKLRER